MSWFYRPEEARGGRKAFHGEKELFTSDHYDWVAKSSINGHCAVHKLKEYQMLKDVTDNDYYTRFSYKASKGEFKPDRVPVYCACEMPYNPDLFMVPPWVGGRAGGILKPKPNVDCAPQTPARVFWGGPGSRALNGATKYGHHVKWIQKYCESVISMSFVCISNTFHILECRTRAWAQTM